MLTLQFLNSIGKIDLLSMNMCEMTNYMIGPGLCTFELIQIGSVLPKV